jgi:hypothetical protein
MVWVGSAATLDAHQPDIEGWAASRQLRLEQPVVETPLPPAPHDDALAERIEGLLGEARTEAYSTDTAAAEAALGTAESLLRSAPGLPESAFLMAEILHQRAMIVAPRDAGAAQELERRAVSLAGPRAAPYVARAEPPARGKKSPDATASGPGTPAPAEPAPSSRSAELLGPLPTDDVQIDGIDVAVPRTIPDGAHHVRVLRAGRLAWTGWLAGQGEAVHVPLPTTAPCSEADLADVQASRQPQKPIACEDYAKARPAGLERIEVALCHGASCGEWLPWSRAWGATFEGPIHSPRTARGDGHAWLLWTAAGVAAVVLGGFALVQAGAFEQRGPTTEKFHYKPPPLPP